MINYLFAFFYNITHIESKYARLKKHAINKTRQYNMLWL